MSNPESTRYEIDKNADVAIREMYQPNKSFVHITPCTVDEDEHVVDYIHTHQMNSQRITEYTDQDDDCVLYPLGKKTTEDIDLDNIKELPIKEYNYQHEEWLKNLNTDLKALSDSIYNQPQVELNE